MNLGLRASKRESQVFVGEEEDETSQDPKGNRTRRDHSRRVIGKAGSLASHKQYRDLDPSIVTSKHRKTMTKMMRVMQSSCFRRNKPVGGYYTFRQGGWSRSQCRTSQPTGTFRAPVGGLAIFTGCIFCKFCKRQKTSNRSFLLQCISSVAWLWSSSGHFGNLDMGETGLESGLHLPTHFIADSLLALGSRGCHLCGEVDPTSLLGSVHRPLLICC